MPFWMRIFCPFLLYIWVFDQTWNSSRIICFSSVHFRFHIWHLPCISMNLKDNVILSICLDWSKTPPADLSVMTRWDESGRMIAFKRIWNPLSANWPFLPETLWDESRRMITFGKYWNRLSANLLFISWTRRERSNRRTVHGNFESGSQPDGRSGRDQRIASEPELLPGSVAKSLLSRFWDADEVIAGRLWNTA